MADVYSIPRNTAGLNNLKMVVYGVQQIAARNDGTYRLPRELFDFTPTHDGIGGHYLPTGSVFNLEELERFFSDAVSAQETARTSNAACLEIVKEILTAELGDLNCLHGSTARAFASFAPADDLREEAKRIRSLLPERVCALQLRVERDWQEYAAKKGWQDGMVAGGCEVILNHKRIFQKIAETEKLPRTLFACCDEDDLTVSNRQIVDDAKSFGLELAFKSDFDSRIESRLMKSVVDFDLCLNLPFYVGLPRSTFSNILCMVCAHVADGHPEHFVFDAVSERCEHRYDFGRTTNAAAAIIRRN